MVSRQRWPVLVIVGAALIFGLTAMWVRPDPVGPDARALQALEAARTAQATEVMVAITSLGNGAITAAIAVLVAAWLWIRGHYKDAAFVAIANLGSRILDVGAKAMFARPRPALDVVAPVISPASFSFPSGHALSAMVLYTSLAMVAARLGHLRLKRALIVLALVVVPTMGFTRLYLGVHYPSDVIGGWALGAAWVWFAYLGYRRP